LVRLSANLGDSPPSESIKVVVSVDGGRNVGIVVDNILDVVRFPVGKRCDAQRAKTVASVVIDQHVTDIVDLASVIQTANVIAG
jgi:hypothetical protein